MTSADRPKWRSRLLEAAGFVRAMLLVLLAAELLARVADTLRSDLGNRRPAQAWSHSSEIVGWEWQPGYKGTIENIHREFDATGLVQIDAADAASPGERTVLLIGDSNTFGFGVPAEATFAEQLEGLLPGVTTINLGVNGYTSYQGLRVLETGLARFHPAAVVVSFNHNDRRAVPPGREDGPLQFQRIHAAAHSSLGRMAASLESLYVYRATRLVLRRIGVLPEDESQLAVDEMHPRVDEAHYRENLEAMAKLAKDGGVPLVFMLLRDNPVQTGYLNYGVERIEEGDMNAAIDALSVLTHGTAFFGDLGRIYLAKAYRALGKDAEAQATLRSGERIISVAGGYPIRLDRDYNRIMLEVAQENGVSVVDAASALEENPYDYIDYCHFNAEGHRKVAALLARELSGIVGVQAR